MEHEAWLFAMAKDEAVVSDLDAKSDAMFEAQRQIADRAWYEDDPLAKAYAARCGGWTGTTRTSPVTAALVLRHRATREEGWRR